MDYQSELYQAVDSAVAGDFSVHGIADDIVPGVEVRTRAARLQIPHQYCRCCTGRGLGIGTRAAAGVGGACHRAIVLRNGRAHLPEADCSRRDVLLPRPHPAPTRRSTASARWRSR